MKPLGILVMSVLVLIASVMHAQIPRTLSYQGLLTDSSGTVVPDGSYGLTFRLYQTGTGGSSLWQETRTLQTHRGVFSANLGEVTPLTLPFDRQYWLGIQMGADPELTPRMELTSAAYSLNATRADTAVSVRRPLSSPIANAEIANRAVSLSKIDTAGAQNNQVITFNGGSVVWGMPSSGGLSLPYSGTANAYNPFSLTNQSTADYSRAIEGISTATSGATYGVGGITNSLSDNAVGTFGLAAGTTGVNSGVLGLTYSSSTASKGVFGSAEAATGETYGVFGQTKSNTGGANGVTGNALGLSGVTYGVYGSTMSSTDGASGLFGFAPATSGMTYGVYGRTQSLSNYTAGLNGYAARTSGISYGVYGATNSGTNGAAGVLGSADRSSGTVYGVYGRTSSSTDFTSGVNGYATSTTGITYGVFGATNSTTSGSVGVFGSAGQSSGGTFGVYGQSFSVVGTGVHGISYGSLGTGVFGRDDLGAGVEGHTRDRYGDGVVGINDSTGVIGALGSFAPGFGGSPTPTAVYGNGGAPGWGGVFDDAFSSGGFYTPLFMMRIDHPGDPANMILQQAGVQSNELVSVYSGNVTTSSSGDAVVLLPEYVQTLNCDFRYQVTVVGQFAQAIIASEIQGNQFTIKTDKPNVKVSWQITGVRQDAFAKTHPLVAEQPKKAGERGYYINPEAFGLPPYPDARLERMKERAAMEKRP